MTLFSLGQRTVLNIRLFKQTYISAYGQTFAQLIVKIYWVIWNNKRAKSSLQENDCSIREI